MKIPTQVPPVQLVNAVQRVRHHLLRLHQSLAPAPAVMAELIMAAWLAQTITVAADLRIADALARNLSTSTNWRIGSAPTQTRWAGCCGH